MVGAFFTATVFVADCLGTVAAAAPAASFFTVGAALAGAALVCVVIGVALAALVAATLVGEASDIVAAVQPTPRIRTSCGGDDI
jgi:hypothetical protein